MGCQAPLTRGVVASHPESLYLDIAVGETLSAPLPVVPRALGFAGKLTDVA